MTRLPCTHCRILTPLHGLTRGFCSRCFAEEAEELPPGDAKAVDQLAVLFCRTGGLKAYGTHQKCGHEKCSCSRMGRKPPIAKGTQGRREPVFTPRDETDLDRYYAPPTTEGYSVRIVQKRSGQHAADNSTDGEGANWQTTEVPSRTEPGCPICWMPLTESHHHTVTERREWADRPMRVIDGEVGGQFVQCRVYAGTTDPSTRACELIEHCPGTFSVDFRRAEDAMIHEVGGYDRKARVGRILARIHPTHRDVLEARHAPAQEVTSSDDILGPLAAVALLTETLTHVRAANGGETPRVTLALMTHDRIDGQLSTIKRDEIRSTLVRIRDDAQRLLLRAQQAYGRTAWELGL